MPLWAPQQQQQLSDDQKRHFQLRALFYGDVAAAAWSGVEKGDAQQQRQMCASAARGGQLQALQWLRDHGCDWDAWTCSSAAHGGHLAVLQWARANGCFWNKLTCSFAARNGHLAVLQWARANGCDWNASTCTAAAEGGHLAVLQWARANGCNWDRRTCSAAGTPRPLGRARVGARQWLPPLRVFEGMWRGGVGFVALLARVCACALGC